MSRSVLMFVAIFLAGGCATVQKAPSEALSQEPPDPTIVMASEVPSLLQGEPLRNAQLASYLAEYELTRRGADCRANRITISYCEGVYTVAFHSVERNDPIEKYTVEIDANNSTILRMTRTKRGAASKQTGV